MINFETEKEKNDREQRERQREIDNIEKAIAEAERKANEENKKGKKNNE